MALAGSGQNGPLTAHPRVDDHQVDGAGGEVAIAGADGDGAAQDVVRSQGMGQVDDPGRDVALENGPLHLTHIGVLESKISGQGDDVGKVHDCIRSCLVSARTQNPASSSIPGRGVSAVVRSPGGCLRVDRLRWTVNPHRPTSF